MADDERPIIIKKIKKGGGHGHHGGAWKVAYADFVTAMMAFFLLMWLLNSTTQEQREGISDYFSPTSVSVSESGSGNVLGGNSLSEISAMRNANAPLLNPVEATEGIEADTDSEENQDGRHSGLTEFEKAQQEREKSRFEKIEEDLKRTIRQTPELQGLADSIMLELTQDGLRIQIMDQENRPMFASGKADMMPYMRVLMLKVSEIIRSAPNDIAIAGHTDAKPYPPGSAYTNWELSSDRANSARRLLKAKGIAADRFAQVEGRAYTDPLLKENPLAPQNRRISITLLYAHKSPLNKEREKATQPIKQGIF